MTTRKRFYIAGPMRGYANFNFPAFDAARDLGRALGYEIISPADMDRQSNFNEKTATPESAAGPEMCREFAYRDSTALVSLRAENGDGIAMLRGWESSTGAVAEFFLARWLKLRIVHAETFDPLDPLTVDWTVLVATVDKYLKGDNGSVEIQTNQQGAMSPVCEPLQGPEPR